MAISNSRLISLENGRVSFEWKDYADGNQIKVMIVEAVEFIRRFLLHVLPTGFVHIRHFGFLANRVRKEKMALCHSLLAAQSPVIDTIPSASCGGDSKIEEECRHRCPICQIGRLIVVEVINPAEMAKVEVAPFPPVSVGQDTS